MPTAAMIGAWQRPLRLKSPPDERFDWAAVVDER
jgi:hypothetical protein